MTPSPVFSHDSRPGPDGAEPLGAARLDKVLVFLGLSAVVHAWALSQGLSWLAPDFSLASRSSPVSDQGVRVQLVSAPPTPETSTPEPAAESAPELAAPPTVEPVSAPVASAALPAAAVLASEQPAKRKQASTVRTAQPAPQKKAARTPPRPVSKPRLAHASTAQPLPAAADSAAPQSAAAAASAPLMQTEGSAAPREVRNVSCEIPQPRYPLESRRNREQGLVVLKAVIDVNGDIERIQVTQSSGYGALDRAARQALEQARCAPYIDNGQRIAVAARLPVAFNLNPSRQP